MEIEQKNLEARYFAERKRRFRIVTATVPALLAVLLWLLTTGLDERYVENMWGVRRDLLLLIAVTLLATSGLSLILTYLQTGFKGSTGTDFEFVRVNELRESKKAEHEREKMVEMFGIYQFELETLKKEVQSTRAALGDLDETSRANLVSEIKVRLQADATSEMLQEIRQQVGAEQQRNLQERELAIRLDDSRLRLQRELDALGRRGNLNLALGALTTVIGISLLGFSVFAEVGTAKDLWTLASHFVPRLALVLLIELFAFFFLSLYKSSLSEIKYFQNELTNIESKQIALRAAMDSKEPALLAEVVGKLAATERNHILSKDQTTIELEKVRIDREAQSSLAKAITEFFQKKN
ncbi:hypothetical protein GmRootA79_53940 (plasmid) [Acidovorax sp. A79]|uniref:hypothetical protein n=1 Tax=Acidovorax sp. A79 TaxID=3056107 RepID=UPI0034E8E1E8